MQNLVIINSGSSGNIHSALKAFERVARECKTNISINVTADPEIITKADRIILPGVGAFRDYKTSLYAISGMHEALEISVRKRGIPFLGICVGAQLMAERGLEFCITPGLGWIKGDVTIIQPKNSTLKIPHMGWNTLNIINSHPLLDGITLGPNGLHAYFVHSFHISTNHNALIAQSDYGGPITAMVGIDNLVGTQFHPEKSQTLGLKFISNFLKWRP